MKYAVLAAIIAISFAFIAPAYGINTPKQKTVRIRQ
jgi:hypothetical protein